MFANRLRDLRKQKDITQVEMARVLGVSQQTIARWESGASTPQLETLTHVAETLAVPVSYFIEESDKKLSESISDCEIEIIDAMMNLVSVLEVRSPKKSVAVLPIDYRVTLSQTLMKNDVVFSLAHNALSSILDAFILCSLERSRIDLNEAIAKLSKKSFDTTSALAKAEKRISESLDTTANYLMKILERLPEELFKSSSDTDSKKSGDSDG